MNNWDWDPGVTPELKYEISQPWGSPTPAFPSLPPSLQLPTPAPHPGVAKAAAAWRALRPSRCDGAGRRAARALDGSGGRQAGGQTASQAGGGGSAGC